MYDFKVKNRKITVGDSYAAPDVLNEFFSKHELNDDYTDEEINFLIDSVAFYLGAEDDLEVMMSMLKDVKNKYNFKP